MPSSWSKQRSRRSTRLGRESGVVIDLLLSYRAVKAWPEMIRLADCMSPPLAASAMVREQLALALNRNGRGDEAEQVLLLLMDRRGPSSETCSILGRVYKDRWESAVRGGRESEACGCLEKAIEAYLTKGFEADWRDAYPGVNAVTLMTLKQPPDPRGRAVDSGGGIRRGTAHGPRAGPTTGITPPCWSWPFSARTNPVRKRPSAMPLFPSGRHGSLKPPSATCGSSERHCDKRGLKIPWAENIEAALAEKVR